MDLVSILVLVLVLVLVLLVLLRLLLADGDLTLLWNERFGKKPDILRGRVAWIIGASGGIGEYLAYELAQAGCRLVLSARRETELNRVRQKCLDLYSCVAPDSVKVLPVNVLDFDGHSKAFESVLKMFGSVDILVNNAGRTQRGLVLDTEFPIEREIMELNYFANVSLTKAVLPHMVERKTGQIVVTSSVAGKFGVPNSASYCATKYALQGWYDSLRSELAGDDISIVLACPGPVFSGIQKAAFTPKPGEEYGIDMQAGEKRMTTERCARLMMVAMVNKIPEVWISQNPALIAVYVAQYFPTFHKRLLKKLGKKAVNDLRHGQIPAVLKKTS